MIVRCPFCDSPMTRFGRGATERKHGRQWACPEAKRQIGTMENTGHQWLWTEAEIRHAKSPVVSRPVVVTDGHPF